MSLDCFAPENTVVHFDPCCTRVCGGQFIQQSSRRNRVEDADLGELGTERGGLPIREDGAPRYRFEIHPQLFEGIIMKTSQFIGAVVLSVLGVATGAQAETYQGVQTVNSVASRADVAAEARVAAREGDLFSEASYSGVASVPSSGADRSAHGAKRCRPPVPATSTVTRRSAGVLAVQPQRRRPCHRARRSPRGRTFEHRCAVSHLRVPQGPLPQGGGLFFRALAWSGSPSAEELVLRCLARQQRGGSPSPNTELAWISEALR